MRVFVSEDVDAEGSPLEPTAFVWRKQRFEVARVIEAWQDASLPAGTRSTKTSWRTRRHRTCVVVETVDGRRFELYCDRGPRGEQRRWRIAYELTTG